MHVVAGQEATGLNEMSLLYYNNILGLPMMIGWLVLGTGELSTVFSYEHLYDASFLVRLGWSVCLSVCV